MRDALAGRPARNESSAITAAGSDRTERPRVLVDPAPLLFDPAAQLAQLGENGLRLFTMKMQLVHPASPRAHASLIGVDLARRAVPDMGAPYEDNH
jgi:hypothetical protein